MGNDDWLGVVDSKRRFFAIGLLAFSALMILLPLLPSGYSSNLPDSISCFATVTTTVTGARIVLSTSTTTGASASTQTITVSTSTVVTTSLCAVQSDEATVSVTLDPLVVVLITIPAAIAEYPLGLTLLAIALVLGYGFIRRQTKSA